MTWNPVVVFIYRMNEVTWPNSIGGVDVDDVTALSRDREPPAAETDRQSSTCHYVLASSSTLRSGRVYSPRYPGNFAPDVDCVYHFQAATSATGNLDERIVVSLLSVQLGQLPGHYSTSR